MSRDITCKEGPWERARRYTLEKTGTIVVPRRPRYMALSVKSHRTTKWPWVDATSEPGDRRPRSKEIMSRDSRVLLPPDSLPTSAPWRSLRRRYRCLVTLELLCLVSGKF